MNLERDVTVLVKWYTTQTRNIVRLEDLMILGDVACKGAEVQMKGGEHTWKGVIIATESETDDEDGVDSLSGDNNQNPNQEECSGPSGEEPENSSLPDVTHTFQPNQEERSGSSAEEPKNLSLPDVDVTHTFQPNQEGRPGSSADDPQNSSLSDIHVAHTFQPNQEERSGSSAEEPQNLSLPDIPVTHTFQETQQRPLMGPLEAPPDIALMDFFGSTLQLPPIGKSTVQNPQNWKRNIQKNKRDRGECYVSRTGKTIPARRVQEACGNKCAFRCTENFTQEDRQKVFDAYWQTGSFLRQRDFIGHHVKEKKPSKRRNHRNPDKSPQRAKRKYYLPNGGDNIRVCFKFFCKTLDIKEKLVRYTLEKKNFCNFRVEEKKTTVPHNKTDEAALQEIRQHIASFPTVGSSPGRGASRRQFLSADLNVTRMYNLYKATSERPQSLKIYRKVFNNEFNLGFQKPKKDN